MRTIFEKKNTGSIYKGATWKQFADGVLKDLLPKYIYPIYYEKNSNILFENKRKSFGYGSEFWEAENNIPELKDNFKNMDDKCFFIKVDGYKNKIPSEVMLYIISKL